MRVELAHEIAADDRQAYRIIALITPMKVGEIEVAYQFLVERISTASPNWEFVSSTTVLELAVKEFRSALIAVAERVHAENTKPSTHLVSENTGSCESAG